MPIIFVFLSISGIRCTRTAMDCTRFLNGSLKNFPSSVVSILFITNCNQPLYVFSLIWIVLNSCGNKNLYKSVIQNDLLVRVYF
jgi:hypothetical protein